MKAASPAFTTHLAQDATQIATLWKVTRRDAQVFRFTDHDRDLSVPGDGLYAAGSAFTASAVETAAELNVDGMRVDAPFGALLISQAELEAGLWDGAQVEVAECIWSDLSAGTVNLRRGVLGPVDHDGRTFSAELYGLMHRLQRQIGRLIMPTCDATLGDARCGVNLPALGVTGTVTSVTSRRQFGTDLVAVADYFTAGYLTFSSGLNNGLSHDIKSQAGGGAVQLQVPAAQTVLVGDTFTAFPGCQKRRLADCQGKFSNVVNFRGFTELPGNDALVRGA